MGLYVILMGVQGAGKGVQAGYINGAYDIPHVSTGDMFRAMKGRDDDLARKVQDLMNSGRLVDDATTNEVVADRLSQPDAANGVILDGYPRNNVQAAFLEDYLAQKGEALTCVLQLKLDLYVAFKRAFGRVKAADGTSYNIYYKNQGLTVTTEKDPHGQFPPRIVATLDATGETLQRRNDDADAAAVITRIETYLDTTRPLIERYENKGLLYTVDAGQAIDAVSESIKQIIEQARAKA
jgi:adenylate kinase